MTDIGEIDTSVESLKRYISHELMPVCTIPETYGEKYTTNNMNNYVGTTTPSKSDLSCSAPVLKITQEAQINETVKFGGKNNFSAAKT